MIKKETIEELVNGYLGDGAMFLVSVSVSPGNVIVVEIDSDNNVDIDACAALSKHIESALDREVVPYELIVASAGLTSTLCVFLLFSMYLYPFLALLTFCGK